MSSCFLLLTPKSIIFVGKPPRYPPWKNGTFPTRDAALYLEPKVLEVANSVVDIQVADPKVLHLNEEGPIFDKAAKANGLILGVLPYCFSKKSNFSCSTISRSAFLTGFVIIVPGRLSKNGRSRVAKRAR